jgi:hypothetical protein
LCFILSLADTIEPLKRNEKYLQEVSIEKCKNKKGFRVEADEVTFDTLYKK